ncbi:MAG TPA: TIGR03545 family protein [Gemmatimonadaceae bacterium]|nr:TIGR03545 family protein [Gemmatimonadaceae bacterium]
MSIPGSARSAELAAQYTPPATPEPPKKRKRARIFRWEGIIPIALLVALLVAGWQLFAGRIIRATLQDAGSDALGTQLDVGSVRVGLLATNVEIRGIAVADPFDRNRNLFEVGGIRVELEPRPLLEKKIVIRRLAVADVKTGTRRATPAEPVTGGGFAPRALAEVQRFAGQFRVPLLSLTPFDELKAVVLDPTQLRSVQAALAVAGGADSVKQALEAGYANLRLQETVDSSQALLARLQGFNLRAAGVDGTRRAIADVRAAQARVDSARNRVERLVADARTGVDTLQGRLRAIEDAKNEDYAFARGLLKLPTFEGPDLGAALFGKVTIDRFQQAVYWATLAREHAPPGLLPREHPGPKRLRQSGTTIQFVEKADYPNFLLRRADVNVDITSGFAAGKYAFAAADITSEPALVGRPMVFAARRTAGGDIDSLRVTGSLDHLGAKPRDVVNMHAAGVKLPAIALPVIPYTMDPGRGTSELRFVLDGNNVSGRWALRSNSLTWVTDSSRARALNTMESIVARALTGIRELELTADISGTLDAPRLAVRSNIDRQVSERLKAVVGEEVKAAEAKVRAQVNRLVEEKAAPARAKVAEVRSEADRRIADARAKLDEEKRKLEERLKSLSGGIPGLPLPRIGA